MAKYILTKIQKGKKYLYQVTDESGNVTAERLSKRDNYIAATADGKFFFSRLDLIKKGEFGRIMNEANRILANPEDVYKEKCKKYGRGWAKEEPYKEWLDYAIQWAEWHKKLYDNIAYLRAGE